MAGPAPMPSDESARLEALLGYQILDTPPDPELDALTRLAAQALGVPIALVSLVDRDRQFFKSHVGTELTQTPRDAHSFCAHAICRPEDLFEIRDASADPRFADGPFVKEDGIRFYAAVPLINREGHTLGTFCVLDRTPRSLTPEQRETLRTVGRQVVAQLELRRLVAVGEFREKLIGILSNDLRSPLLSILLAARQGLGRGMLPPEEERQVSEIAVTAERLTRVIRDVLDFTQARLGAGLTLRRQSLVVREVCAAVVSEFRLAHPGRSILFTATDDGSADADADRLTQLLTNLLANALRYGDAVSPVRVTCGGDDEWAVISVWNSGPGISPETLPRLFSPFVRGSRRDETAPGGLGLGLFIAREIAHAHGGEISVDSSDEYGTTFTLKLPRAHASGPHPRRRMLN